MHLFYISVENLHAAFISAERCEVPVYIWHLRVLLWYTRALTLQGHGVIRIYFITDTIGYENGLKMHDIEYSAKTFWSFLYQVNKLICTVLCTGRKCFYVTEMAPIPLDCCFCFQFADRRVVQALTILLCTSPCRPKMTLFMKDYHKSELLITGTS